MFLFKNIGMLLVGIVLSLPGWSHACTLDMNLTGVIGPASLDFLQRGFKKAEAESCASVLLRINTPGGNLQSTRFIVEEILNSSRPVLCLISPAGGHAGSAGAIIMQACHVNGAIEATNIGAATPISESGENIGKDLREKVLNDTQSWVEGLAKLRGRNIEFAKDIVVKAKAVDAKEAAAIGAIDTMVPTVEKFLEFSQGRETQLPNGATGKVSVEELVYFDPGIRHELLQFITDPQFAYMVFMGSLGLLYFEVTHPGMIVPGVIGGIGLVISMVSFHKLNVDWAGVVLIFLGLGLMFAEAFVPSFGALGIGGLSSFVIGSLLLYDPEKSGVHLSMGVILVPALVLGGLTFLLARMAFKNFSSRKKKSVDEFEGKLGTVVELENEQGLGGYIEINGETWKFKTDQKLNLKDKVIVIGQSGLTLSVKKS